MIQEKIRPDPDIELAVRPHPARTGWRVMRVAYRGVPEHESRVARAIDALFAPTPDIDAASPVVEEAANVAGG